MPENAEVLIMSEVMNTLAKNSKLVEIEINTKSKYYEKGINNFDNIKLPLKLKRIYSKGKVIIFELDKNINIVCNPIYGKWLTEPGKYSGFILTFEKNNNEISFYFDDMRKFGLINIYINKEDFEKKINKNGIDILRSLLENKENELKKIWFNAFSNKKKENKEIGKFLLEQDKFAGIGNYLRAEILYDSKISPYRKLSSLSEEDINKLYNSTKKIVLEAYKSGGHTISVYSDPLGAIGRYNPKIYGKKTDSYGNDILRDKNKDGRSIYWVPKIQK